MALRYRSEVLDTSELEQAMELVSEVEAFDPVGPPDMGSMETVSPRPPEPIWVYPSSSVDTPSAPDWKEDSGSDVDTDCQVNSEPDAYKEEKVLRSLRHYSTEHSSVSGSPDSLVVSSRANRIEIRRLPRHFQELEELLHSVINWALCPNQETLSLMKGGRELHTWAHPSRKKPVIPPKPPVTVKPTHDTTAWDGFLDRDWTIERRSGQGRQGVSSAFLKKVPGLLDLMKESGIEWTNEKDALLWALTNSKILKAHTKMLRVQTLMLKS
ncbi:hypothetical protein QKQ00_gp2 [Wuhan redfin culter dimarhabdovirus]|uniref:Uncharacterized protein n=1 Tax=Wuhan redfin culter dimarhabdovirus TaxID=3071315 RepID=A0AAD0MN00_9RHAB|nr:hypothetical protein QKQ00_gp2 [Wuhan redfin culter dimarhabodovirus]AVM87286.1 hypothetical protein [Wuhan redfin culter dimarhabodovirus]